MINYKIWPSMFVFKGHYIQELLVAFSLVAISQTNLRFSGFPFGIGELILLGVIVHWGCLSIYSYKYRAGYSWTDTEVVYDTNSYSRSANIIVTYFMLAFIVITLISTSHSFQLYASENIFYGEHNLVAYILASFIFFYFLRSGLNYTIVGYVFCFGLLGILCLQYCFLPADLLYYQGIRLTGMSSNPNQLALNLLCLPWMLFSLKSDKRQLVLTVVCCCLAVAFMILTQSHALYVAYLSCIPILLFYLAREVLPIRVFKASVLITILAFGAVLWLNADNFSHSFLKYKEVLNDHLVIKLDELTNANLKIATGCRDLTSMTNPDCRQMERFNSEAFTRVALSLQAIKIVIDHPFLGFGAGAGVMQLSTQLLSEVHNSILDLAIQTGLIGLVLYLAFLGAILYEISRSKQNIILLLMFLVINVFSLSHLCFRQPIFWFYLAYIYMYAKESNARRLVIMDHSTNKNSNIG